MIMTLTVGEKYPYLIDRKYKEVVITKFEKEDTNYSSHYFSGLPKPTWYRVYYRWKIKVLGIFTAWNYSATYARDFCTTVNKAQELPVTSISVEV